MISQSLVSVIIPTYNRRDMLKQALDSVLVQDYLYMEIIVADNASTDGTDLMMEKYCKQYSFIKYMRHSENLGSSQNGHLAYLEATGEYMMILCDDDFLAGSSFFLKAVKAMEENKNIAFTRGLAVTLRGEDVPSSYYIEACNTRPLIDGLEFYLNYERPGYEHVVGFFGLFRKQWIDESDLMSEPRSSLDRWLWSVLALYGDVYFIPEIIGYYREHNATRDSTSVEFAMQFFEIYNVVTMISQLAIQRYPHKKEEILADRNPEIEAAHIINAYLAIIRPFKSDTEILKMIQPLRKYSLLYKELVITMGLGSKNKLLKIFVKIVNKILKKIGIKIERSRDT